MFGLLGSLFTFAFALLTRGDDEEPAGVQSRPAWLFFSATLGILIVLALVVPQLLGSSWMWRLRKDGLRDLRAPHEPIKFDVEDLTTKAEALFDEIDVNPRNGRLSLEELKEAVNKAARKAAQAEKDAAAAQPTIQQAPKDSPDAHQNKELEKAELEKASTAVLETIVRQVEERTRKKQSLMEKLMGVQRADRMKEAQLTKPQWDENIAESLY
jgi:hypothetical protein